MYSPAASTVAKRSAVNTEKEVDYSLNKIEQHRKKLMRLIDRLSILLTNMTMLSWNSVRGPMNALEMSFQNILMVMLRDGVSLCIKRKKRKAFLLSIHTQSHPAQM